MKFFQKMHFKKYRFFRLASFLPYLFLSSSRQILILTFFLALPVGVAISLSSCAKENDSLKRVLLEKLQTTDEQLTGYESPKNNFFFSNNSFTYTPFFSSFDNTSVLYNQSIQTLFYKENENLTAIKDPLLDSFLNVVVGKNHTIVIIDGGFRRIGLVMATPSENGMELKNIYPFFQPTRAHFDEAHMSKSLRIASYENQKFNVKITSHLLARISEERFAKWYLFDPSKILEKKVNAIYLDFFLGKKSEHINLVIKLSLEVDGGDLGIFSYDLDEKTEKKSLTISLNRGIFFDTTGDNELIATGYLQDEASYFFDYYSLVDGQFIKSKKFPVVTSKAYPLGLTFNGKNLIGFYASKDGISLLKWE